MKQAKPDYSKQLAGLQHLFIRYRILITVLFFAGLAGWLIVNTNRIASLPTDETAVLQQTQTTSTPRISEETSDIIRSLDSQNINIQSDINNDRNNPFAE